ncbi:MAG: hypothetical protein EOR04_11455 [Mesorhizobium sp.]|uniref:hypothetical protein n=1 Tax=Mesorhizobium sp. TaxID=1871066 RepID=UPI000FE4DDE2|nr:hypothetical protein [Mesorhizobium sp.]RWP42426.1 MAG: hypothetical protein EOR04_11455 [Mesorhizobium sp.]
MDYAKVVTVGVAGWLSFERACDRSGLFSEKYLAAAVGQILSARTGDRVEAEFAHPVLAPLTTGRGRRPAVDFVVRDPARKIVLAVETKWVGRSAPSTETILWDLIRLELIAHHENARCLFILAGPAVKLQKIFEHSAFSDEATKPQRRPLLRHDNNVLHSTPLVPLVPVRFAMMKRMFEHYREVRFPERIVTRRTAPKPDITKPRDYQVFTWEVMALTNRHEFRPGRSKYFS